MVSSTLVSGRSVDCLLVLVVDDEAAMREVVSMRLADWGYDVCVAADGAEAGRLIQERRPDLVISDVVLPDMTGLELLSHLTAGEPTRPVIMMTAYGTVELAVGAMKQGAQDFLTKPLDYSKLKAVLAAAGRDLSLRTEVRDLDQELQCHTGDPRSDPACGRNGRVCPDHGRERNRERAGGPDHSRVERSTRRSLHRHQRGCDGREPDRE